MTSRQEIDSLRLPLKKPSFIPGKLALLLFVFILSILLIGYFIAGDGNLLILGALLAIAIGLTLLLHFFAITLEFIQYRWDYLLFNQEGISFKPNIFSKRLTIPWEEILNFQFKLRDYVDSPETTPVMGSGLYAIQFDFLVITTKGQVSYILNDRRILPNLDQLFYFLNQYRKDLVDMTEPQLNQFKL